MGTVSLMSPRHAEWTVKYESANCVNCADLVGHSAPVGVAQWIRALACGARSRRFESYHQRRSWKWRRVEVQILPPPSGGEAQRQSVS